MTATIADRTLETVPCPACGGTKWTAVREARNPLFDSSVRFQVVRCECGFHFTNPRPPLHLLGQYYPDDYANYQADDGSSGAERGSLRNLVLRDAFGSPSMQPGVLGGIVAKFVRLIRPAESFGFALPWRGQGRLLDFGCGSGKFLRRMHALGWDVTGIDFGEEAVKRVRESGLRALHGTLPQEELKPGTFDVVTMRQALEHVPDPRATLKHAWELLDRGGLLLVAVPNYASWEMERFGEASMLLDLPRHLNHFTPGTLAAMMRDVGLTNIRVKVKSRASWVRKAATRAKEPSIFTSSGAARVAAMAARMRERGNELIATAEKP
jgi:2-polyprenyl-3-methyl-5-hydroxy-6-metoxy-1,4-benzoquinol methylase